MSKFKVGDIVKVKVFKNRPYHWIKEMEKWMGKWMGKEVTVKHIECDSRGRVLNVSIEEDKNDGGWRWLESDFEIAEFLTDKDLLL